MVLDGRLIHSANNDTDGLLCRQNTVLLLFVYTLEGFCKGHVQ